MPNRRICLLLTDLEIGGTPTVVRELAIRLHNPPRVEIEVACLKPPGPVADQIKAAGINVTALGVTRPRQLFSAARGLRDLVETRQIDTVFSFLVHANVVAALAAKRLSYVRFLQSIQTVQPRPRWHWWAQRWAHRRAEKMIVPSTAVVQAAQERSGIPPSKCIVIPNAVDPADFPPVAVFGPNRPIRAGYLGRLDPAKDPGMLLNALEFACMDDAELHYFGDGPQRDDLEKCAAHMPLPLRPRIHFHGAVPRPQNALQQIDVLWLPSWVEGFGLVLIEAMASGVPVVAIGTGGVIDIVQDEHNGLLADAMFPYRRFAASLWLLRDKPDLRQKLIENGLRTVQERFTWEKVLPQYRNLLTIDD
jgi:glycosyltransferase involved in cell wall biosynthesis